MKTKTVYFVTCPSALTKGGNPNLTLPTARDTLHGLKSMLPKKQPMVYAGTGSRHIEMCAVLGLPANRLNPIIGSPEIWRHDGVLLASGRVVEKSQYNHTGIEAGLLDIILVSLEDTVFACDPHLLYHLGEPQALWGRVYEVTIPGNGKPIKLSDIQLRLLEPE